MAGATRLHDRTVGGVGDGRGRGAAVGLERDGTPAGPVLAEPDLVEAVRSRPGVSRWVWRSTAVWPPAAGVRVERCYDIECAELLLLGHAGRLGEPRSAAAALARLGERARATGPARPVRRTGCAVLPLRTAVRPRGPLRGAAPGLRGPGAPPRGRRAPGPDAAADRVGVGGDARRCRDAPVGAALAGRCPPGRPGTGCWASGTRAAASPGRLAELADEVSAAFGRRVRPDLPADVVKAFAQARDIVGRLTPAVGAGGAGRTRWSARRARWRPTRGAALRLAAHHPPRLADPARREAAPPGRRPASPRRGRPARSPGPPVRRPPPPYRHRVRRPAARRRR
ncbi:hypothetical protein SMICM17S_09738 [Streptomyces microflavus]